MKLTRHEAELLCVAVETRMRIINDYLTHPIISTAFDEEGKKRLCDDSEAYVRLMRKVELSRKATLRKELNL